MEILTIIKTSQMINVQWGESVPINVKQIKAFSTRAEAQKFYCSLSTEKHSLLNNIALT